MISLSLGLPKLLFKLHHCHLQLKKKIFQLQLLFILSLGVDLTLKSGLVSNSGVSLLRLPYRIPVAYATGIYFLTMLEAEKPKVKVLPGLVP